MNQIAPPTVLWRLALCSACLPSSLYLMSVWHRPGILAFIGSALVWASGFFGEFQRWRERYLVMTGVSFFMAWASLVLPRVMPPMAIAFLFGFLFVLAIVFERGWREREALIMSGVIPRKPVDAAPSDKVSGAEPRRSVD